jgi:hypothetical protein
MMGQDVTHKINASMRKTECISRECYLKRPLADKVHRFKPAQTNSAPSTTSKEMICKEIVAMPADVSQCVSAN